MKWYNHDKKELDYTRPIVAEDSISGRRLLLVPRCGSGYRTDGYDWFDPVDGEYTSCAHFETVKAAMNARAGHKFYNARVVLKKADE